MNAYQQRRAERKRLHDVERIVSTANIRNMWAEDGTPRLVGATGKMRWHGMTGHNLNGSRPFSGRSGRAHIVARTTTD